MTPVTSLGNRSGVNWSRRTEQSIERASAFANLVLPHLRHSTFGAGQREAARILEDVVARAKRLWSG